ncbi:MAG: hypothetical protein IJH48_05545 [Oscillospiraceae bacterium]|nr:hypothetical protein [Oscillospiraceae bacterium]
MTPKEECEELLDFLLFFAEHQLKKRGEFYPFGAVMLESGEITATAFYDADNEFPDSTEEIGILTEIHKEEAEKGEIRASGICWDAKVSLENSDMTDAIVISLEHRESYSVVVGQPYRLGFLKKLDLSNIFALDGRHDVFN